MPSLVPPEAVIWLDTLLNILLMFPFPSPYVLFHFSLLSVLLLLLLLYIFSYFLSPQFFPSSCSHLPHLSMSFFLFSHFQWDQQASLWGLSLTNSGECVLVRKGLWIYFRPPTIPIWNRQQGFPAVQTRLTKWTSGHEEVSFKLKNMLPFSITANTL